MRLPLQFEHQDGFSTRHWPSDVAEIRAEAFPPWYAGKPDRIAYPQDFLVTARLYGVVAAYAHVDTGANPGVCYLRELAVARPHRGMGIGECLVRDAARWLAPMFRVMYVQPLEGDGAEGLRIAWLERLGFHQASPLEMHDALLAELAISLQ